MGGTHDFFDMFVPMHMDLNTQSFYAPNDGYTRVTENYWNSGFTDPAEAGGLLAHEEIHHLGWDGLNTTLAKPTRRSRAAVSSETGLTAPSELEIRFILSSSQHWRFKAGRFRRQHQMWARSWTSSSTPSFRRPRRSRVWRCRRAASPLTLHGRMRRSDMCPSLPRPLWRLGCVEQWKLGTPQCSVTAIPRDVGLVLRSAAASMSRSRRRRVARSRVIGYASSARHDAPFVAGLQRRRHCATNVERWLARRGNRIVLGGVVGRASLTTHARVNLEDGQGSASNRLTTAGRFHLPARGGPALGLALRPAADSPCGDLRKVRVRARPPPPRRGTTTC
jgi:hypothetical protein